MKLHKELERASRAAEAGEADVLERVLRATPAVLEARGPGGHTLLGLACRAVTGDVALPPIQGTTEQYKALACILAAGADPSAAAEDGWAPLHTAAMTGNVELAQLLLSAGASRSGKLLGCSGGSPLSLALFYGQSTVAELLAAPPIPDNFRTAASLGHPLERFQVGEQLTAEASSGCDFYRPLMSFPAWDRTNSRQELLDEALSWAARNGRVDSMSALVKWGANVNSNAYRGTPMLWAVYADRDGAVSWLLKHGADPNLRHDFGGEGHGVNAVALHLAAQYGAMKSLVILLEHGADVTIRDGAFGATPLEWARYGGENDAAQLLDDAAGPNAMR